MEIDEFISLKDENAELKRKLRNATKEKSRYKRLYESLRPAARSRRLKKTQDALDLIAKRESGELNIKLVEISERTGVSYGTLKHLAWEYRQAIK